jgi:hypothetical protein
MKGEDPNLPAVRSIAWLDGLLAMHNAQDLTIGAPDVGFCDATREAARKCPSNMPNVVFKRSPEWTL